MTPERAEAEVIPISARPDRAEVLLWDDSFRTYVEASSLYFWRLSFVPSYHRDKIFAALSNFYANTRITSHVTYEVLGEFDLLVRMWIPRQLVASEIKNRLFDELAGLSLYRAEYLQCQTYTHWAGNKMPTNIELSASNTSPMALGPTDELIESINAYNAAQVAFFNANRSWNKTSSKPSTSAPVRPEGVEPLLDDKDLVSIPLDSRGTRFFITFDHPIKAINDAEQDDILHKIYNKCSEICGMWQTRLNLDLPPQFSIYYGHGDMTDFLVMARAPDGHFNEYTHDLVLGLRKVHLDRQYRMRTYTHVLADEMFSDLVEHRQVQTTDFDETIVTRPESDVLEFKASFAVDVRRAWRTGTNAADDRIRDFVIKAVCGFLNSPTGGTLVLGVLEVEREIQRAGGHADMLLKWLEGNFNYKPAQNAEEESVSFPNAVLGVDWEYGPDGPYSDADAYLNAIRNTLSDTIQPSPFSWIRILQREVHERSVIVVSVRPAHTWCFAQLSTDKDPQFFVREAASTRAAKGYEAELYRDANRRPTLGSGWGRSV